MKSRNNLNLNSKLNSNLYLETGNALFIILLAIALFAALSYAVTQSSSGTKNISDEATDLKIDQILEFAQALKTGTQYIYTNNGISESDIRFAHPDLNSAYGDPATLPPSQMVFHPSGGGVTYKKPPSGVNDGTDWFFTGSSCVSNVGTGMTGSCASAGSSGSELLAILPNVTKEVCLKLNQKLNITNPSGNPPKDDINMYNIATQHFNGTFATSYSLYANELNGKTAGCFEGDVLPAAGTYHFYQVLLER